MIFRDLRNDIKIALDSFKSKPTQSTLPKNCQLYPLQIDMTPQKSKLDSSQDCIR